MKFTQKIIPEGINTSDDNPLKELIMLTSGVIVIIVLLITLLNYLLDWATPYIPFHYEQQLAKPFVEQLTDKPNEVSDYLQSLADKITADMALPDELSITVHYLDNKADEDVVNAMATIGGHVFIYKGLLKELKSENAIVALLGHEIAHVKFRHPLKSLNKGVIISLLMAFIGGQSSSDVTSMFMDTQMLTLLNFSREQEQDADYEALIISHTQYQHSKGLIELLQVLKQQEQQSQIPRLQLLNSHPETTHRITNIINKTKQKNWFNEGKLTAIPKQMLEIINSESAN